MGNNLKYLFLASDPVSWKENWLCGWAFSISQLWTHTLQPQCQALSPDCHLPVVYPFFVSVSSLVKLGWMHTKSLQPYLTLCDLMDCSPPGSSVHGMSQARILEWAAIPFSRGSSLPRDWTPPGFCLLAWFLPLVSPSGFCRCQVGLYHWATRKSWASLVAQLVKNPPAVQKTWV